MRRSGRQEMQPYTSGNYRSVAYCRLAVAKRCNHRLQRFYGSVAYRRSVDYGSIYASKTFATKDGRRVLLGWVFETAAGCVEQCSAGTNFTDSLVRHASRSCYHIAN